MRAEGVETFLSFGPAAFVGSSLGVTYCSLLKSDLSSIPIYLQVHGTIPTSRTVDKDWQRGTYALTSRQQQTVAAGKSRHIMGGVTCILSNASHSQMHSQHHVHPMQLQPAAERLTGSQNVQCRCAQLTEILDGPPFSRTGVTPTDIGLKRIERKTSLWRNPSRSFLNLF